MSNRESSAFAPADDPRVSAALQEYLAELEAGRRPDRAAYVARYPDLVETLGDALDGLEFVHGAAKSKPRAPEPAPVPPMLGDFRILREIGRGGMGVVYEAEQLSLNRRVALKVLPFAAALDGRHLHRFKNEAQAAAHLHHSHIVPVYAVGCDRGVHYYAMQYIEGQSLADAIREWRQALPGSQRDSATGSFDDAVLVAPSTRERAAATTQGLPLTRDTKSLTRLGVQAADALEYAHAMGVVHRDIKPGNLLVEPRGHLWVADFGLAQMHGVHDVTVSGDVLGTLRYMSPEQASGRRGSIDHHADIYSLGVTLYELFTLHDPYPARDREELLRRILHDEPIAPRKVNRELPVELETILLKAMAKTPFERYATAQEFADDLRRFLDDRPVLARRPSLAQVAGKWARRHRGLVGSAIALVFVSCIALAVVAWALNRSREQTANALYQARAARQESRRAFDSLYEVADKVFGNPQRLAEKRGFLERALDFYERFSGEYGDDPLVKLEQARAYINVGNIRQQLGDFGRVADAYGKARQILDPLADAAGPDGEARRLLAECCNSEGIFAAQTGRTDQAAQLFRQAAELQQGVLKETPDDERARFALAKHTSNLGAILLEERKYDAARQSLESALQHLERYLDAKAEPSTGDRRQLALNHHNLGVVHHRTQQMELARRHWDKSQAICQSLVHANPFDAQFLDALAASTLSLGVLCHDNNDFADAEGYFREAQAGYAKLMGQFPNIPSYRSEHGRSTHGLARSLKEQGKIAEAGSVLAGSEVLLEKLTREYPDVVAYRIDLLKSRIDHANVLADAGQLADAEAVGGRAWSEAAEGDAKLPPKPDVLAHWLALRNNLADYAWRAGRRDDAAEGFRAASVIGEQLIAEYPAAAEYRVTLAGVRADHARLLHQMQRYDEAEAIVQALLGDYEALSSDPATRARWMRERVWALVRLAQVCIDRDNEAAVRVVWKQAVATADRLADEFSDRPIALIGASWFYSLCPNPAFRDKQKALRWAERANRLADESPEAARALGLALYRAGDGPGAVDALQRARRLFKQRDRVTDLILAMALAQSGRTSAGRREYVQACKQIDAAHEHGDDLERLRAEADRRFGSGRN